VCSLVITFMRRSIVDSKQVESTVPVRRRAAPWATRTTSETCHAWTDGSFEKSAGLGWVVTRDDTSAGPNIAKGPRTLGARLAAYDAGVEAIEAALAWYQTSSLRNIIIHSDSMSAISRAAHSGAGPGQWRAIGIQKIISGMVLEEGKTEQNA
jgi:hypothetical protein